MLVPKIACVGRKRIGVVQGEGYMETSQANAHDEQVKANEHSREPGSMGTVVGRAERGDLRQLMTRWTS